MISMASATPPGPWPCQPWWRWSTKGAPHVCWQTPVASTAPPPSSSRHGFRDWPKGEIGPQLGLQRPSNAPCHHKVFSWLGGQIKQTQSKSLTNPCSFPDLPLKGNTWEFLSLNSWQNSAKQTPSEATLCVKQRVYYPTSIVQNSTKRDWNQFWHPCPTDS